MYGVQLFYVVSAFTLFLSFIRRKETELAVNRNFYIRRFFRIAPMYYLAIVYYLWQNGFGTRGKWMSGEPGITPANILSNVFFLHGTNPNWINTVVPGGWSVAVEMSFYLFVPLLVRWIRSSSQAFLFILFSLVGQFILHRLFAPIQPIPSVWLWEQYLYLYLPSQLPVFGLGILMYYLIYPDASRPVSVSAKWYLAAISLWLLTLMQSKSGMLPPHILFGLSFMGLGIALSRYLAPILVNPILGYIGRISYSMYLTHFAVIVFVNNYAQPYLHGIESTWPGIASFSLRYWLVVVPTVVLSSIFFRLVEVPGQNLGRLIIRRMSPKVIPDVVSNVYP